MNDYEIHENKLYVGRFQKKSERLAELQRKYEQRKQDRLQKYQGSNLYVKNLEEKINDEYLQKEFGKFGDITSAKVFFLLLLRLFHLYQSFLNK